VISSLLNGHAARFTGLTEVVSKTATPPEDRNPRRVLSCVRTRGDSWSHADGLIQAPIISEFLERVNRDRYGRKAHRGQVRFLAGKEAGRGAN